MNEGPADLVMDNIVVKKTSVDGQNSVVPLHSLLVPERNNEQKILEVTQKITDLLMEENENWSNFNVIIKEEIEDGEEEDSVQKGRECLEGHKDLYKDVMMENQPPLTSPDESSNRNPPERCPRPLNCRDSTQEDHTIPHHHQGIGVFAIKTEVKAEEETYMRGNQLSMKETEMVVTATKEETSLDASTGIAGCCCPRQNAFGITPLGTGAGAVQEALANAALLPPQPLASSTAGFI